MAVKDAGELSVSTVRKKYGKANSDSTINPTAREPTVFDYFKQISLRFIYRYFLQLNGLCRVVMCLVLRWVKQLDQLL